MVGSASWINRSFDTPFMVVRQFAFFLILIFPIFCPGQVNGIFKSFVFFWSTRPTHSHSGYCSLLLHMSSFRTSVHPSPLFKTKQMSSGNNVHYWVTVGLAKWIIDDTFLFELLNLRKIEENHCPKKKIVLLNSMCLILEGCIGC